jgi:hypothetical protein
MHVNLVKAPAAHFPGPGGVNSWFGHPATLTVEGRNADSG